MRYLFVVILLMNLPLAQNSSAQNTDFDNILFIHHSVGNGMILFGNVRDSIEQYNSRTGANLQLWDHHMNSTGLRDPDGNYGYGNYNIPYDNTNPDGYYEIFNQPLHNPPDNAFSYITLPHLLGSEMVTHEIIAFKSCYFASEITSDQMLENYRTWFLAMRDVMDAHPEKIFIPFTTPPHVRNLTTPEIAARVHQFTEWLTSDFYLNGHPNIFVFDIWSILADHDSTSANYNCLRTDYRDDPNDSHPNVAANQILGPQFVSFIINAISAYSNPQPSYIGDLDCNGIPYEISDAVLGMQVLGNRQATLPDSCISANGNIDFDRLNLSAGDICRMYNIMNFDTLEVIGPQVQSDSLIISTVSGEPGDTVEVGIYLSSVDDIQGFQFGLRIFPSDFRVLSFTADSQFPNLIYNDYGNSAYSFDCILNQYSGIYLPAGRYLIGNIRVEISENAPPEAIGTIEFFEDPSMAIYGGIAFRSAPPLFYRDINKRAGYIQLSHSFAPGDVNGSGTVNGVDVVYLVNYFKGGDAIPVPVFRADANGNCEVNGIDVGYLVNYFKGGAVPLMGDCMTSFKKH